MATLAWCGSSRPYDKFGQILRIETTTTNVSFFRHYREVEQRNGETVMKFARMKKSIYSLAPLRELMAAANRRYREFLSAIENPRAGVVKLHKVTRTIHQAARSYRGFNSFDQNDEAIFLALARGEFNISGMQNKTLRANFPPIQQRPDVEDSPAASCPRADRKSQPLLQVLPHCLRQRGRHAGPQTQELVIIPQLAADSI